MKKLAIISSHPIQYNAPWFRMLAERKNVLPKVFYTWGQTEKGEKYDPGFGKNVNWDIPLLDGYEFEFVPNVASNPGSHHFRGIVTPELIPRVNKWNPDAVLVIGWSFVSHLKCLRFFSKKKPVYFRGDSTLIGRQKGFKGLLRRAFLKWVYSHVNKVFYVGTHNKSYFLSNGVKGNNLVFAPHAIDNARFADAPHRYKEQVMQWKAGLGIQPGELVILFAGKLEPVKNPEWIIEASKQLRDMPVKFLMAGNGPLEDKLKGQVKGDNRFLFIDFQNQSNMPVVYRLAEVFILSSHSETWGLGINEAMACGRVILASEGCGCATDLVKKGINGFIFDIRNPDTLANQIRYLYQHKNELTEMGLQSERIISVWNFENICKAIENTMKDNHL